MENNTDRRERTVYVSGMHPNVNEEMIYELFTQAGPIEKVILHEATDGSPHHALVIFKNVSSVMYSIALLNGISLYARPLNLRPLRESTHAAALERAIASQMRTSTGSPHSPPPSPEPTNEEPQGNQHPQGPVQDPWATSNGGSSNIGGGGSTYSQSPNSPMRPKTGSVRGMSYRAGNSGWNSPRNNGAHLSPSSMYGGSGNGYWSMAPRPNYNYSGSPYSPYAAYATGMQTGNAYSTPRMPTYPASRLTPSTSRFGGQTFA